MEIKDTYKTIESPSPETLYKEKSSKFFGYAFPISTEEQIKTIVENLRKLHTNARHICYAYQIGTENCIYRANDDGEPNNSAGAPIYGQIQSFGLTNILVVVLRFFGGTKLGVGGLITAYKTSAKITLESCNIIERTIDIYFTISFDYQKMNTAMRIIKEKNLEIVSQKMELNEIIGLNIVIIELKTRKKIQK